MTRLRPILLVEDNLKDIELTLSALKKSKIANEIVVARDGSEALDYLNCRGKFLSRELGHPVVVFLDLKMPKVDGIEVLATNEGRRYVQAYPSGDADLVARRSGFGEKL
jgi:CheY-like chemotaxis protein